jgi:hypothetical protein
VFSSRYVSSEKIGMLSIMLKMIMITLLIVKSCNFSPTYVSFGGIT